MLRLRDDLGVSEGGHFWSKSAGFVLTFEMALYGGLSIAVTVCEDVQHCGIRGGLGNWGPVGLRLLDWYAVVDGRRDSLGRILNFIIIFKLSR